MEAIKSVLEFNSYVVNEISYKRNSNFISNSSTPIKLNVEPKIEITQNEMVVNLITTVFEKSAENNYPFEMKIDISGFFSTSGDDPRKFQANAIAILYPYIRSIVSTYTASANISPLILPALNINAMIESQNKN